MTPAPPDALMPMVALTLLSALLLDLLLGDPRGWPHPVRWLGALAARLETSCRRRFASETLAGTAASLCVYLAAAVPAFALPWLCGKIHPALGLAAGAVCIYFAVAARDLVDHALAVHAPLAAGDLAEARHRVGWIVGRDTAALDAGGVARAAVESVAESTLDGVLAPLFWAAVGGAAAGVPGAACGALLYRAVNTLDSLFGHKDERYLRFGRAPARIDDAFNWLPARLGLPFLALAAALCAEQAGRALRIGWRDARRHASPNAGFAEATVAGALGVRLGGTNHYDGRPHEAPVLHEEGAAPAPRDILRATGIVHASVALYAALVALLALMDR